MSRMNLISPRPGKEGKTFWHKIGAAFPRDAGGYSLVFDSLPIPDKEGRVSLLMVEPMDRDNNQGGGRQQSQGGGGFKNDLQGDDIPFAPEFR